MERTIQINGDYNGMLEIAGAKVIAYQSFGSYQGDWIAEVVYNGKHGYVHSYYGSCSGCDALQAEFDFSSHDHFDTNYYNPLYNGVDTTCETCMSVYKKMQEFGASYLKEIISYDEILANISKNLEWDSDAEEMVKWVKEHAPKN